MERPQIKDFLSQQELYNYAQGLDTYIDFLQKQAEMLQISVEKCNNWEEDVIQMKQSIIIHQPSDTEVKEWYEKNIGQDENVAGAIYKFRIWLRNLQKEAAFKKLDRDSMFNIADRCLTKEKQESDDASRLMVISDAIQEALKFQRKPMLKVKKLDDGTVHRIWKLINDAEGEVNIWCNDWYGHHVIGKDCAFVTEEPISTIELLKEVRTRFLHDVDQDGEPKSSMSDLMKMWEKVNAAIEQIC